MGRFQTERLVGVLALCAGIALVAAGSAGAATLRVSISGSSSQTVVGDPGPSTIQLLGVSANVPPSGDIGDSPSGALTVTWPAGTCAPYSSRTTFDGDLSLGGCVRTEGNQTVVIAMLPADEQYDVPNFGHIQWVVAAVEDNGPASATVDRASDGLLKTKTGNKWCGF